MSPANLHRPPWRWSLATRLATVWALLLGLAVGLSSGITHRDARRRLVEELRQRIGQDASEIGLRLETWMRSIQEDSRSCSQSPLVREFLVNQDRDNHWRSLLEDEFRAVFAGKPAYFQMRLLSDGEENAGQEMLRLDRMDGHLVVTPPDKLQSKAERAYFKEARKAPPGAVYLSDANLNRDFGGLSFPHIPTIRAAIKVGEKTNNPAMLVINADLRPLFNEIRGLASEGIEIRLYDDKDDYLLHPDQKATFASDLGHHIRPSTEQSGWYAPPEGSKDQWVPGGTTKNELALGRHFHLGRWPERQFTLIVSLLEQSWLPDLRRSQYRGIWATVLATFAGAAVGVMISLPLTRQLRHLSSQLREFDATDNPEPMNLSDTGRDEVGIAVTRFREMAAKVREQVESLQAARDEAEEANATKEAFLAVMSHEIRTPMNAVVGLIRALEANHPPAHQRPILDSLKSSASNLMALLNTALDFTRLRDGSLQFISETFDAARLVREVGHSHKPSALAKQLHLEIHVPDSLYVEGDPVRLRQIVNNLVNNALKFTKDGFVRIDLAHKRDRLVMSVTDSGPGIEIDNQASVFTPFVTAHNPDADQAETGAGLGLPVSKELAEKQGGELTLDSKPGSGCRFTLKLPYPLKTPRPETLADKDGGVKASVPTGLRILYVEDVASNRQVMELTLKDTDIDLHFAETGKAALNKLRNTAFDLVLLDLQLPDMSGDVLARRILETHSEVPILAVTAQSSARTDQRLRDAGIRAVAIKPFSAVEILSLLSTHSRHPFARALESLHPDHPERSRQLAATMADELRNTSQTLVHLKNQPFDQHSIRVIKEESHKLKTAVSLFHLDQLERALAALCRKPDQQQLNKAVSELEQSANALDEVFADE